MERRTFNKLAGVAAVDTLIGRGTLAAGSSGAGSIKSPWDGYMLGTAYYPEWWPRAEWEIDFREMAELGINTVRMGEFAWAIFEPEAGKFDFSWMDDAIRVANRHRIRVVLGTGTASVPPWLYQYHPDVLSGNERGPYTYGGRKGYNTNSPNYLDACARLVTALAEHYGTNAGVIGWQLDNEPGYPFQSFDPDSERAFRIWLHKRYGTLKELNRVWNGAFWSNEYTDWSQIHFPTNSAEGGWQPAITLAYREFFSDSFLNHLRIQAEILRAKAKNQFIFTNWPAPTWSVNVYTAASEFLDATAWDNYVSAPGLSGFRHQFTAGYLSDFARCAGPHQRFICAEQNAYVPPNAPHEGLRLQAYMDLAHGGHGHFYFEWRRPLAGNEQFRPSFIKGFDGALNPAAPTLRKTCKEMSRIGPRVARAITRADIAILFDFANQWAQGFGSLGPRETRYDSEVPRYYNGFKVLQRNVDVVPLSANFSPYQVILAPNLRLVDDAAVKRLHQFVAAGGTLVLNNRAGTQHRDNSMRRTLSPGAFADIAGVHSVAILDLIEYNARRGNFEPSLEAQLGIVFAGKQNVFRPRTIVESLILRGAEPLATVTGAGEMSGRPAVTRNRRGNGWVFYVGTDCADDAFYETVARLVGAAVKLTPLIAAPYGVEVTSRQDADTTFHFLLNLTTEAHHNIPLPAPMDDLVGEREGIRQVSLGPLDVAVLAAH